MNDNITQDHKEAIRILEQNSRDDRYTVPTEGLYPFQWNWDSCLTALGWAKIDEDRAWKEIHTLFDSQWTNGMVPHIVFHKTSDDYFPNHNVWGVPSDPPTSSISQPPVAATCIRKLYEQSPDKDAAKNHIRQLIDKLYGYHSWYHTCRDPENTGLVVTYHPWETGRDNCPDWDDALMAVPVKEKGDYVRRDTDHVDPEQRPGADEYDRYMALVRFYAEHDHDPEEIYNKCPFKMIDVGINAILLRANKDLIWLMETCGVQDQNKTDQLQRWTTLQTEALEHLWDEEHQAYRCKDAYTGKFVDLTSSASFLPLYAEAVPEDRAKTMVKMMESWTEKVKYMVPSADPNSNAFEPIRYWRGPVWAIVNYMITDGLRAYGEKDFADRIGKDTAELIQNNGFYEYFDPQTGRGLGGDVFSWTSAMWLTWAEEYACEPSPVHDKAPKRISTQPPP